MDEIWVISRESGGYNGSDVYTMESVERKILGLKDEYYEARKTYFKSRKEAEDYWLPIAKQAYDFMLSDMEANWDEEEEGKEEYIAKWSDRGFHMIRQEELEEGDKFYEIYHDEQESTTFVCPVEHDYDRIGCFFGGISRVKVY